MNKLMFFIFLGLSASAQLTAQDGHRQAPASIQRSFQRDYPQAQNPRWSSYNRQWHADFEDRSPYDRGEMVAHYDRYGHHVDSHIRYDRNDVPAPVIQRTERNYPGASYYTYTRIEHPGRQPLFQISFNLQGRNRTTYMDEYGRKREYNDRH